MLNSMSISYNCCEVQWRIFLSKNEFLKSSSFAVQDTNDVFDEIICFDVFNIYLKKISLIFQCLFSHFIYSHKIYQLFINFARILISETKIKYASIYLSLFILLIF